MTLRKTLWEPTKPDLHPPESSWHGYRYRNRFGIIASFSVKVNTPNSGIFISDSPNPLAKNLEITDQDILYVLAAGFMTRWSNHEF